jgi:hypothetical protein
MFRDDITVKPETRMHEGIKICKESRNSLKTTRNDRSILKMVSKTHRDKKIFGVIEGNKVYIFSNFLFNSNEEAYNTLTLNGI